MLVFVALRQKNGCLDRRQLSQYLRQRIHERGRARGGQRLTKFAFVGIRLGDQQIRANGIMEQERLLQHVSNRGAPRLRHFIGQFALVDPYSAITRPQQAGDQIQESAFARTGRAGQNRERSGLQAETDFAHGFPTSVVMAETDLFEANALAQTETILRLIVRRFTRGFHMPSRDQ